MNLRCILSYHLMRILTSGEATLVMECSRCGSKFKVIQLQRSIIIHAPKEKLYAQTVNFLDWPKLYPDLQSTRLVSKHNGERVIECVFKDKDKKGRIRRTNMTQRIVSVNRIDEEQPSSKNITLFIVQTYNGNGEESEYTIHGCLYFPRVNFLHPMIFAILRGRMEKALSLILQRMLERKKRAAESS